MKYKKSHTNVTDSFTQNNKYPENNYTHDNKITTKMTKYL